MAEAKTTSDWRTGLGWLLIVVGLAIAIAWTLYISSEQANLTRRMNTADLLTGSWSRLHDARGQLTYWPGIIGGAGVTAFGILLLALRR